MKGRGEFRGEHAQEARQHHQFHAGLLQAIRHRLAERRARRVIAGEDDRGGDARTPRAFQRVGTGIIADHQRDAALDLARRDVLEDRLHIGPAPRGEHADGYRSVSHADILTWAMPTTQWDSDQLSVFSAAHD